MRRLGVARDGVDPPVDCRRTPKVMLWHADLAAESRTRIEGRSWSASELWIYLTTASQDTLLAKAAASALPATEHHPRHRRCRIDADLLLGERSETCSRRSPTTSVLTGPLFMICGRRPATGRSCLTSVTCRSCRIRTICRAAMGQLLRALADAYGRGIRYGDGRSS